MKIVDFFDQIYCINLPHRTDRWEKAISEFNKIGILESVNRVDGILNEKGAIGCRDSHLKIINDAKDNNYKRILIFEDDVYFHNPNIELIEKSLDDLCGIDYDILYFGATLDYSCKLEKFTTNLVKTNFAYTTHAYSLTEKNYDFILENAKNNNIIDVFYNIEIVKKNNNSFIINPMVAIQQPNNYSDIEKGIFHNYNWMVDFFNEIKNKSNI